MPLGQISIVSVLPAGQGATVTAFILSIKLGEFECDERGLRLAQEDGDSAQCARVLPAVPTSKSHYVWASQPIGLCVRVCVCVHEITLLNVIIVNQHLSVFSPFPLPLCSIIHTFVIYSLEEKWLNNARYFRLNLLKTSAEEGFF